MNDYSVIIPNELSPKPDKYERIVAELCAKQFDSNIEFIVRGVHNTPDIRVVASGKTWEIKNIRGTGKHTIEDNLRKAKKQSPNIIISLLRPGAMEVQQALSRINFYLNHNSTGIDRVMLITKGKKIIDVK